jgi:hypothetical protein
MLEELLAATEEGDDEDAWFLSLTGIEWRDRKLGDGGDEIELSLHLSREHLPSSDWSIRCSFAIDYRFEDSAIDRIEHVTDAAHPLLARYLDLHASLFFRGAVEKPDELIGALLAEHRASCGNWTSLDSHLQDNAAAALAGGSGLLARGPRKLLEHYATVLERHGVEPSIVGGMPFQELRGGKRQPRTRPAEALLLGSSFVVADSFTAKRR